MKKLWVSLVFALIVLAVSAQQNDSTNSSGLGGLLKKTNDALKSSKTNSGGGSLTSDEIVAGLKEALSVGAQKSTGKLSTLDGFLKDAAVKNLIPEEVRKIYSRMRVLGMGRLMDDAITSMNRAAEDASKTATPIFIAAIKKMTVQDALGILRGKDTAATSYLKSATSNELTNAFRPIIEHSLKKVNATKYWGEVFTVYNKFSTTPVTADVNEYVTERALRGIFYYVAEEEKKIRANPAARVTDILRKVFGGK
ncbi:MAG: DUF4197 domain-containing protein [Chitinophagaceae bacterium]